MHRLPANLMSDGALRQRDGELRRARRALDAELARINAVLAARAPAPRSSAEHGTQAGYRAHKRTWRTEPCEPCKAAHATYNAEQKTRREARAASRPVDRPEVPTQRQGAAR